MNPMNKEVFGAILSVDQNQKGFKFEERKGYQPDQQQLAVNQSGEQKREGKELSSSILTSSNAQQIYPQIQNQNNASYINVQNGIPQNNGIQQNIIPLDQSNKQSVSQIPPNNYYPTQIQQAYQQPQQQQQSIQQPYYSYPQNPYGQYPYQTQGNSYQQSQLAHQQQYYQQQYYPQQHQYPHASIPPQNYTQQNPPVYPSQQSYPQQSTYYLYPSQQNPYPQQNIYGGNQPQNYQTPYNAPPPQNYPPPQTSFESNQYLKQQQKQIQSNNNIQQVPPQNFQQNSTLQQNQNERNNTQQLREGQIQLQQAQNSNQNNNSNNYSINKNVGNEQQSIDETKLNGGNTYRQSLNNNQGSAYQSNQNNSNNYSQKGYSKHFRNRDNDNQDSKSTQKDISKKLQKNSRRQNSRERDRQDSERISSKNDLSEYQSNRSRMDKLNNQSKYNNKGKGSSRHNVSSSISSASSRRKYSSQSRSSASQSSQSSRYSRNRHRHRRHYSRSDSSDSKSSFHSRSSRNNPKQKKQGQVSKQRSNNIGSTSDLVSISSDKRNNYKVSSQNNIGEKQVNSKIRKINRNGNLVNNNLSEINEDQQKKTQFKVVKRPIKSITLINSKNQTELKKIYNQSGQKSDSTQQDSFDDDVKYNQEPIIEFSFKKETPKLRLDKLNIFNNSQDEVNEDSDNGLKRTATNNYHHHHHHHHRNTTQQSKGVKPSLSRQLLDQIKDSPQKYQEQQTEKQPQQLQKIIFSIDYNQLNEKEQASSTQSESLRKLQNSQMFFYNILGKEKRGYTQTMNLQNKITKIHEEKEEQLNQEPSNNSNKETEDFNSDDIVGSGMNQNRYFCDRKGQICFKCGKSGHVRNACLQNEEKDACIFCLGNHYMAKCTQKVCFKCGEIGHERTQCPVMNQETTSSYNLYQKKRIPKCNICTKMGHLSYDCGIIRPNYDAKQNLSFNYNPYDYDVSSLVCQFCGQNGHVSCYKNITAYDTLYTQQKLPPAFKVSLYKLAYKNKDHKNIEENITHEEEEDQDKDLNIQQVIESQEKQKQICEEFEEDEEQQIQISDQEQQYQQEEEEGEEQQLQIYDEEKEQLMEDEVYQITGQDNQQIEEEELIIKSPESQEYYSEKVIGVEEQNHLIEQNNNQETFIHEQNEQSQNELQQKVISIESDTV